MKRLLKGDKRRYYTTMAARIGLAVLLLVGVRVAIPTIAYAYVISISFISTPVTVGGNTTLSWATSPGADQCTIYGPTFPQHCDTPGSCVNGATFVGDHGSTVTGPINGSTYYTIQCWNGAASFGNSTGQGQTSMTVTPSNPSCPAGQHLSGSTCVPDDNCPVAAPVFSDTRTRQLGAGTYNIVGYGYDFCVTNNGTPYFVPMNSATEIGAFQSAVQSRFSGSITQFARTPGY
jgi:hypothetical protein